MGKKCNKINLLAIYSYMHISHTEDIILTPAVVDALKAEKTLIVPNRSGIHCRVAALIIQKLAGLECNVVIRKTGRAGEWDARSIMSLVTMCGTYGQELHFIAEGRDAGKALDTMERLFDSGFGEFEEKKPAKAAAATAQGRTSPRRQRKPRTPKPRTQTDKP